MKISLDRNLVISAGAGTGKTHALATIALGLYAGAGRAPLAVDRVWVMTFTEKAATELRDRIVRRARGLADRDEAWNSEPELASAVSDRGDARQLLRAAVERLTFAPIGTFHSLSGRILRRFAAEAGIDASFSILAEAAAQGLRQEIASRVLLDGLGGGAPRILARELGFTAATHTLLSMWSRTREEPTFPTRIPPALVPLELGRRCADLARALDAVEHSPTPRFSALRSVLATERRRIGSCEVDAMERWFPAVARVLDTPIGRGALPGPAKAHWSHLREVWEGVCGAAAGVRESEYVAALTETLAEFDRCYRAEKAVRNALDFSDLVHGVHNVMRERLGALRSLRRRVGALLIDEFQDCNHLQVEIVHGLAESGDTFSSPHAGLTARMSAIAPAKVCAVGDRKQAIYGFRGADPSVFSDWLAHARGHALQWRAEVLARSHRSIPGLVDIQNRIFAGVLGESGASGWDLSVDPLTSIRPDPGEPAIQWMNGSGDINMAARQVATMIAGGVYAGDVAVLLRSHRQVDDAIHALELVGVAALCGAGAERPPPEGVDLAALVTLLADPGAEFAAAVLWRSPWVGISDDALFRLGLTGSFSLARGAGLGLELAPDDAERLNLAREPLTAIARAVPMIGLRDATELAIDALGVARHGIDAMLVRLFADGDPMLRAAAWLRGDFDRETGESLQDAADVDAVRVFTVHGSKGLEFPIVVLPELDRKFPAPWDCVLFDPVRGFAFGSRDATGNLAWSPTGDQIRRSLRERAESEDARLLYVAFTRARDLLILGGEVAGADRLSWAAKLSRRVPEWAVIEVPLQVAVPHRGEGEPMEPGPARPVVAVPGPPRGLSSSVGGLAEWVDRGATDWAFEFDTSRAALARAGVRDTESPGLEAHEILEGVDLEWAAVDPEAAVAAAASRAGFEVEPALRQQLSGFFAGPIGLEVLAAYSDDRRRVMRETPFCLCVAGHEITGRIDLLYIADDGGIVIVDYKHAHSRPDEPKAWAFQLATYALAARRLWPGLPIRAGLVMLRDHPEDQLAREMSDLQLMQHEHRLASLMA